MLVHSFSLSRGRLTDFEEFARLLRAESVMNKVVLGGTRSGIHLPIGWVCGNEEYLSE
jgi:hypothetical protein